MVSNTCIYYTVWTFLLFSTFNDISAFIFDYNNLPSTFDRMKQERTLVLVGGNLAENNSEIYSTIVKLAGGQGVARIGIITAASSDPIGNFIYYRDIFTGRYGAQSASWIPIHVNFSTAVQDPGVIRLIQEQTGFFFGGGDPYRVIQSFFNNGRVVPLALKAIKSMYRNGTVVAGTSAGIECLSSAVMVKGGTSYEALKYGAFPTTDKNHPDYLSYEQDGGLGFIDGFVIDAHFTQRGRQGRMIRLLADTHHMTNGVSYGIGVDENTALIVISNGAKNTRGKVIGQYGVSFFDISQSVIGTRKFFFYVSDVRMSYLTNGDSLNLNTLDVMFSMSKTPITGTGNYSGIVTSSDIFGGYKYDKRKSEFDRTALSVFSSEKYITVNGYTKENNPTFHVLFRRGTKSQGFIESGTTSSLEYIAYKDLNITIVAM